MGHCNNALICLLILALFMLQFMKHLFFGNNMLAEGEIYIFERRCKGLIVPSAEPITILPGTEVQVTQYKGGSATVLFEGNLIRIVNEELVRLGLSEDRFSYDPNKIAKGPVDLDNVWEQLTTCYDPEIPVNIVELGLVYECKVSPDEENNKNTVEIKMTLTAPGCSMGPVLLEDIKSKVYQVENVTDVDVELVFDPPWSQDMLSDAAKLHLGLF